MAGPWEDYQQQPASQPKAAAGPWEDYKVDPASQAFEQQIAGMDETDISIARSKNTPLGEYLRIQAQTPQDGETPQQQQERLYGSLSEQENGALDHVRAFTSNVVDGVPIAGPYLNKGVKPP